MSYQNSYSTEARITEFLRSHPDAPVRVVVGYASVWGLAWLHRHTKGRRVHLLIGDMRKHHFDRASDRDKQQALKFLARPDVEISNWYKKKPQPSEARIKAWMIESPGKVAVLTGTANLTKKGIQYNRELMMEPSGKDLNYAVSTIKRLFVNSWDCRDKLSRHITSSNSAPSPSTITEPAKRATQRRTDYNAAAAEPTTAEKTTTETTSTTAGHTTTKNQPHAAAGAPTIAMAATITITADRTITEGEATSEDEATIAGITTTEDDTINEHEDEAGDIGRFSAMKSGERTRIWIASQKPCNQIKL